MRVFRTIDSLREWRRSVDGSVGFVPTMGALHPGHRCLMEAAVASNAWALVSIYVNPTQFNDSVDCSTYPTPLQADLAMCEAAGVSAVFLPDFEGLYPDQYRFRVQETRDSAILEGRSRPGHFEGMLTVVLKLLILARADRAYFGEKDWQQLHLVRGLCEAFLLETQIVPIETVREADGLAMSSRNTRLSPAARAKASVLNKVIRGAGSPAEAAEQLVAEGFTVDYVEDWSQRRLA
ncbi:MAG: pantothenate synthetase, partial [Verrucomicrobiota bacterium]